MGWESQMTPACSEPFTKGPPFEVVDKTLAKVITHFE
jgi:hypothetical protein